jgi:homoserine O-acetyltransferase
MLAKDRVRACYDEVTPSMIVERSSVSFDSITLDNGSTLAPVEVAYQTYGKLNAAKSNAILIEHAFSGDAHAAGIDPETGKSGWWDSMIGPGKGFDTDRYFVICTNVLGGCRGTTGPGSIDPATGCPYALKFPVITIGDMVRLQRMTIDWFGIPRLLAVTGGSMGGMQALEWAVAYPDRVVSAIPIASTTRHSAQQIAFNEVGRQAIMFDPNWNNGDYYGKQLPAGGLSVARMVGHITYMSDHSMREKFGRRLRDKDNLSYSFGVDFEVESYLRYRGSQFVNRFDANSYLYITKAMDYFDLTQGRGTLEETLARTQASFQVISFSSDWLYPSYQSQEMVRALQAVGRDVSYTEVQSNYGHDSFLLDVNEQPDVVRAFLWRMEGSAHACPAATWLAT